MRKLFLWASLFMMSAMANAVPAKRGNWKTVTIEDGRQVRVELCGDEFGHFWRAEDGTAYQKVETTGMYRVLDLDEFVRNCERQRVERQSGVLKSRQKIIGQGGNYTGHKKGLIILAEFADLKFQDGHDQALYNRIANEENFVDTQLGFQGSIRDYFSAQSDGQFDFEFDVRGPVTLSKNYAYYGQNYNGGIDRYAGTMIAEACRLVNGNTNFQDYDWDGDGVVEQVFVIYPGKGEADQGGEDDPDRVWPHTSQINQLLDNVYVRTYACSSELRGTGTLAGIGTICHEFTHCFGLPDFYDKKYSNYGMGWWSIMDNGAYLNGGFTPPSYTAYERMYINWRQPIELKEPVVVSGMEPITMQGNTYIIYNDGNRNEFFMLENRCRDGWDSALMGEGLLVTHVDYDATVWAFNDVNTTTEASSGNTHQRCTVVAADGSYVANVNDIAADLFPYGKANYVNNSTPGATLFNKNTDGTKNMNKPVTRITRDNEGLIGFYFMMDDDLDYYIFYETFDGCAGTGGNNGTFTGVNKAFKPDNEGWTATRKYGADQCALFGNNTTAGEATTPEFYVAGSADLSFLAAPYSGDGTTLKVQTTGDVTVSPDEFTMVDGKWSSFTAKLTGWGNCRLTFVPEKRLYLDEVAVMKNSSTGIDEISVEQGRQQDGRVFDLGGRYVGKDLNSLQHGIYIVNGRKVVK